MNLNLSRRELFRASALAFAGFAPVACGKKTNDTRVFQSPKEPPMASISDSWSRIHTWLGNNAPKIHKSLNEGASDVAIADAEKTIGLPMPDDWREMYRVHNGMNLEANHGSLFYGMRFLSIEAAVADIKQSRDAKKRSGEKYAPDPIKMADPGILKNDLHNEGWIPLANDWGDMVVRVDLNPAPDGKRGQIIATDHANQVAILLAPNLGHFLADFASDLESGKYFLNTDALDDGQEFLSCVAEIDVVNWWKSPRWKHLEKQG